MPGMALLVIDMLNDFFRLHAHLAAQRTRLVAAVNALAGAFREHGQPVTSLTVPVSSPGRFFATGS
jgi:nicotinamidase-related amidase